MTKAVSIDEMPGVVHEPYAFLLDETNVEPIVERTGFGRMRLTHLGDRTKMTIDFRLSGRKWRWQESRLFIDGKRVPNADSPEMYVSIYRDPDGGRRNHVPAGARKAEIPESRAVEEAYLPVGVAEAVKAFRRMATKDTVTVTPTISLKGDEYLITAVDTGRDDEVAIVLFYGRQGDGTGSLGWAPVGALAVNALGYDVTQYLEGGLHATLVRVLGAQGRASQVPHIPNGGPQSAATTNSTLVRKATVFRV